MVADPIISLFASICLVAVKEVPLSQERERFTGMFPEVWDSFPSRVMVMPLMVARCGG
jgi:hypothetical protein